MRNLILILSFSLISCFSQAASWEAHEFKKMSYQIYIPETVDAKHSLMLSLHGCAQKAQDLAQHGNWESAAEKHSTIVVLPQVPNGGALMGCWDYYGSDQNEQNKDNAILIEFTESLLNDAKLNIDPRQVYVTGLSSGGAQALLLGCLRPDLFSGVGLNSSPAIPSEAQDISKPPITADQMAQFCKKISGARESHFQNQKVSVIVSDQDYIVSTAHSKIIVDAMKDVLQLQTQQNLDLSTLQGSNQKGEGVLYLNSEGKAQLSFIINQGMGHNWPAGGGSSGGSFITQNSINYPLYVLDFFESSSQGRPRLKAPRRF